jgi:SAM-dependent methyltransferase
MDETGLMSLVDMREHALADIEVAASRGLEIGPLARPIVPKSAGSVFYVDHASRDELREKYAADTNMQPLLDHIVDVDFVLKDGLSLHEAAGPEAPFDYVIACHVIEHIPDIVTWLKEMAVLLPPGGILSLVVPDKRYTFDVNRAVTDISEVIDAYLNRIERPTSAHIYDFSAKAINGMVDPAEAWAGKDYTDIVRRDCDDPDLAALRHCEAANESSEFLDIHCQVFTPRSFLTTVEKLMKLGLLPFTISSFFPTEVDDIEFFVSLRRLTDGQLASSPLAVQLDSLAKARNRLAQTEAAETLMVVSALERRMIEAKRRTLLALRRAAAIRRPGFAIKRTRFLEDQ